MVILLGLLLCAAPATAVGHQHARAADRSGVALAPLVGAAPAEAAPLDRVGVAPRRLTGYVMDDSTIITAVAAWFYDATAAEATYGHISTWETGAVTDMDGLFCAVYGGYRCNTAAASFNEDISAWDISGVTTMIGMFQDALAFNQDLGWCLDDDVIRNYAFSYSGCASTSCGVVRCPTKEKEQTPVAIIAGAAAAAALLLVVGVVAYVVVPPHD